MRKLIPMATANRIKLIQWNKSIRSTETRKFTAKKTEDAIFAYSNHPENFTCNGNFIIILETK